MKESYNRFHDTAIKTACIFVGYRMRSALLMMPLPQAAVVKIRLQTAILQSHLAPRDDTGPGNLLQPVFAQWSRQGYLSRWQICWEPHGTRNLLYRTRKRSQGGGGASRFATSQTAGSCVEPPPPWLVLFCSLPPASASASAG